MFGYRPDIPQSGGAEAALGWGPNGVNNGGYPNADDWPSVLDHIVYGPGPLPAFDLNVPARATLYNNNTGPFPGGDSLGITASHTFGDGTTYSISNAPHWGGFYGILRGSNGQITANGFPWSTSGGTPTSPDFGRTTPFAPGLASVNFYIYDIRTSTPSADAFGHTTYDLTSAPQTTGTTNKARGRISIKRKPYSAKYLYGETTLDGKPVHAGIDNTFLIQGLYEITGIEGSFLDTNGGPFSASDIGKAVGTWGQPLRFFPGVFYNDFNFRNMIVDGKLNEFNQLKYMTYQFLPANLKVKRYYDICECELKVIVWNTGDVDLKNVTLTDPTLTGIAPFDLNAGSYKVIKQTLSTLPDLGNATATSNIFNIERATDLQGNTGTLADGTANGFNPAGSSPPTVPEPSPVTVSASSSETYLEKCIEICGTVFRDKDCDGKVDWGEDIKGVLVTLTGTDLNGNSVGPLCDYTDWCGVYCFKNLKPGTYTITITPRWGYVAVQSLPGDSGTSDGPTKIIVEAKTPCVEDYKKHNFNMVKLCDFTTYTQGGWGSSPSGYNPGWFLKTYFSKVYPSGCVIIGGGYTLKFTSAYAIQCFLPRGGTPAKLTTSSTNPTSGYSVFAGQALALQLNVDFSNACKTQYGLAGLHLKKGKLIGYTVAEVLALANKVLGGDTSVLPSGLTISGLNDIVTAINENFDGGDDDDDDDDDWGWGCDCDNGYLGQ